MSGGGKHRGQPDGWAKIFKRPAPAAGHNGPVEPPEHIAALERDGALLAAAAERAGLDAVVPPCAPWRVRDLLRHLGFVHRWAAGYVSQAREEMTDEPAEDELLLAGPGDAELLGWFRDGHAELVRALRVADPGLRCWTFLPAPSSLAFWARRQAHETAIHRVDAESAAGEVTSFPASFASDGVDELIMGFWARGRAHADRPSCLRIQATDTGGEWLVELGAGTAARRRAATADAVVADCTVAGPASDLYLLLWNRPRPGDQNADRVTVGGDPRVLRLWQDLMKVRWS
jgi:uncharacterized protein (TIGR03083 family)